MNVFVGIGLLVMGIGLGYLLARFLDKRVPIPEPSPLINTIRPTQVMDEQAMYTALLSERHRIKTRWAYLTGKQLESLDELMDAYASLRTACAQGIKFKYVHNPNFGRADGGLGY